MIFESLQKLPNNVGSGFELLPKVKKIAQSGHTVHDIGSGWATYYGST